ncbi:helix-turn-helix transcriptional regulator [Neobacillus sp. WH10]|uniref:helix-turn-helix domain-containing protein n=1 Tax=Neobacillus sp. WH10 TaxID=3047873 RepID=UPI0024C1C179|nr:helix-turn-helix transcriptional regulator [Neobacillus sp. WH10]WHY76107.1 helix-turn-helix transcriptional regulator [Neobacillus sp. WH10]
MTLGKILKDLRTKNRWTLKEVAQKLGLSGHSTYSNWEYGRTEPDVEMLKKIAILYDVDLKYLLTGSNEEVDYESHDLKELLGAKILTWGDEVLDEEERKKAIEVINILLKKQKDTN